MSYYDGTIELEREVTALNSALAAERAKTTRLTALEAALKAALAECEAWREHKGLGSPCSLLDYPIRKAMSETDRLRKECAL